MVFKAWVNMFKFFSRDQVVIFLVMDFILVNIIIFHVLLLWIKKVSVFIIIVHMMNMVIWVFKSE